MGEPRYQPYLHDLTIALRAPTVALSAADGQMSGAGVEGLLHADVRVLRLAEVSAEGASTAHVATLTHDASTVEFVAVLPGVGDAGPDPTVRLRRVRSLSAGGMTEQLVVESDAAADVGLDIRVDLACDLAPLQVVRASRRVPDVTPVLSAEDVEWSGSSGRVGVTPSAGAHIEATGDLVRLHWSIAVPAHGSARMEWTLHAVVPEAVVTSYGGRLPWSVPVVESADPRVARLVSRSLDDLGALLMVTCDEPAAPFLGAGAPWYFTLFGRDSLWAARQLLPVSTTVALGTLTTLAQRQGARVDEWSAEAPGKILHELRAEASSHGAHVRTGGHELELPPVYYGTVDATALWVCLLHDAWRWGISIDEVRALLPALRRALGWLRDAAGDEGFIAYVDASGRGLANQGWKDSTDAIRFATGEIAEGPVALCEVQGYAYEAATAGARLLDALGDQSADQWRDWAAALRERFRAAYWVGDAGSRHPALALDGKGAAVDSLTSNIGHLLGTGLLDDDESRLVADALTGDDMCGPWGLRTMSSRMTAYAPMSYHCGSVWPHDTAIVMAGLVKSGLAESVAPLGRGLTAAGEAFGYRLPELWAGMDGGVPVPYPTACRPQAWSAASAVTLLVTGLGLDADVPNGRLQVRPPRPSWLGAVRVNGLRVGDEEIVVDIDADGTVIEVSGTSLEVVTD